MKFLPKNKRFLLERVDLQEKLANSSLEEFASSFSKKQKNPTNEVYRVVDFSGDCTLVINSGCLVVIEGNMVEETKVGDKSYITVKENFIIGSLKEDDPDIPG